MCKLKAGGIKLSRNSTKIQRQEKILLDKQFRLAFSYWQRVEF